jgi:regulator of protease activity HflC (stomatin/prohibitin superfamily)
VGFWASLVVVLLSFVAIFVVRWLTSLHVVPPNHVEVVFGRGKRARLLQPGRHTLIPFWEYTVGRYDVREQTVKVETTIITSDNAWLLVRADVRFQIVDPIRAAGVAYPDRVVEQVVTFGLRNSVIPRTAEQALDSPASMIAEAHRDTERIEEYGLVVRQIDITHLERVLPETLAPPVS